MGQQSEPLASVRASGCESVTPPPHQPGLLHSWSLLPTPEPCCSHCSLTPHSEGCAEAPALVGSAGTHGARESSQLTWRPEGRDSHKQQGWDHRVDLGCSPAQTHSTRPASTATPQPALVGHREKVGVNLGKPTQKAAWAPPPTLIPGRCHVSGPASGSGPLRSGPSPTASGSQAALPPGGARQPETVEEVGVGQCWGAFASEKQPRLGAAGGGAWTLTQRPFPGLGGPPPAETPRTQGNNGNGRGGGGGVRQTKALQAPPLASLPSSRYYSSVPSLPPRLSVRVWHCEGQGLESWMRAATFPPTSVALPPPDALINLEPPSLQSLPLGRPPAASRPS